MRYASPDQARALSLEQLLLLLLGHELVQWHELVMGDVDEEFRLGKDGDVKVLGNARGELQRAVSERKASKWSEYLRSV
jgi:hypothetical protein